MAPWKKPYAVHDPGKVLLDLAITLALGGDALSDSTALRDEPDLHGPVASKATITRIIQTLAADVDRGLTAINAARAAARTQVWELADKYVPNHDSNAQSPMIIDRPIHFALWSRSFSLHHSPSDMFMTSTAR